VFELVVQPHEVTPVRLAPLDRFHAEFSDSGRMMRPGGTRPQVRAQIRRPVVHEDSTPGECPHITLDLSIWHNMKTTALQQVSEFVADCEAGDRRARLDVQPDDHVLGFGCAISDRRTSNRNNFV